MVTCVGMYMLYAALDSFSLRFVFAYLFVEYIYISVEFVVHIRNEGSSGLISRPSCIEARVYRDEVVINQWKKGYFV